MFSQCICFIVQLSRENEVCRKASSELEENKKKYKDDVSSLYKTILIFLIIIYPICLIRFYK